MGVGTCAMLGLYSIVCRDPDTASGGATPSEALLHASGFLRHSGTSILDDIPGDGIDRRVDIVYIGTDSWHTYNSSSASSKMRSFPLLVRIGYFAGSHDIETQAIMADDDQLVCEEIRKSWLWPDCSAGCVNGYYPLSSGVVELEDDRYILEIRVEVTVTG